MKPTKKKHRSLNIERLEQRQLLTAQILSVEVGSTAWETELISKIESNTQALPWTNVDQLTLRFSEPAVITSDQLTIRGGQSGSRLVESFKYDAQSQSATWTLTGVLPSDRFLLELDGDGLQPATDEDGAAIDGDWNHGQYFPSGDGAAGGDFEFPFSVLPGDANQDGVVSESDFEILKAQFGSKRTGLESDFDRNGLVEFADFLILSHGFGRPLEASIVDQVTLRASSDQFVATDVIAVELGQLSGSRVIELEVTDDFGSLLGHTIADLLTLELIDANTGGRLLANGPLFSLAGGEAEFDPGLVQYRDGIVTANVGADSGVSDAIVTATLMNFSGAESTVTVGLKSNHVDIERDFAAPIEVANSPTAAGGEVMLEAFEVNENIHVAISDVTYDAATSTIIGSIQVQNAGVAAGRNVIVVVDGLPVSARVTNSSGSTADGKPYLNFRPAIGSGGLPSNGHSETIALEIHNPDLKFLPISFSVLTSGNNVAPAFEPIERVTLSPGEVEQIQLVASDVDGDDVTYRLASNMALPNVRLTGNGSLTVSPTLEHIGEYAFEVIASDGVAETTQLVELNVVADIVTTTRLTGVVQNTSLHPLLGVRVSFGAAETTTDAEGVFKLEFDSSEVADALLIHGEDIVGDAAYPFIAEKIPLLLGRELIDGVNNQIARPIYLPPLDVAEATTINPTEDTTVSTPNLAGVELMVAAGSLVNADGSAYDGDVSITEVPRDLTPAALPTTLIPATVITIQPGDMSFTQPAPLTFPNSQNYAPGSPFDLWSINPDTGEFDDVGDMEVSADGQRIETISGGVRSSSWHFPSPPANEPEPPKPDPDECPCPNSSGPGTSEFELRTGAVIESHRLVTYQSVGETRGVELIYDSLRADARSIIDISYDDLPPSSADQFTLAARVTLSGKDTEFQIPGAPAGTLGLNEGFHFWQPSTANSVKVSLQADLRDVPSGRYRYDVESGFLRTSDALATGSLAETNGNVIHVNTRQSPFGAGWGLAGHQQLVENGDGTVLLIDGDGNEMLFYPPTQPGQAYRSPVADFSTLVKEDGAFRRTMKDQMVYQFGADNQLASVTDRNGKRTSYEYRNGLLTGITDPVGLVTKLSYSAGYLISVTDPANRETRFEHDNAGNLIAVVDPDNSSRQWRYDDEHHIIEETTKRGHTETTRYDVFGRVQSGIRADGSVVELMAAETRYLLPPSTTTLADDPPIAFLNVGRNSTYIRPDGSVDIYEFDDFGQPTNQTSVLGDISETLRYQNGLARVVNSPTGGTTSFEYDTNGNVVVERVSDRTQSQAASNTMFLGQAVWVDNSPVAVLVVDTNYDAIPDLVSLNENANSLTVLHGIGDGNFITKFDYPLDATPMEMAQGDINGDGISDLAIATSGGLYVFFGDGQAFTEPEQLGDENILSIAIGDFGGDSNLDIAQLTVDSTVSIIASADGNNFLPASNFDADAGRIFAIDVDGDGRTDIVNASDERDQNVNLFFNNGEFSFEKRILETEHRVSKVTSGDLNLDGTDEVILGYGDPTEGIAIVASTGGRELSIQSEIFSTANKLVDLGVEDLNNDGLPDIVALHGWFLDTIDVYLANETQFGFEDPISLPTGSKSTTLAIADLDSDGLKDFAVSESRANSISLIFGSETSVFEGRVRLSDLDLEQRQWAVGDFTGDGNDDVVIFDSPAAIYLVKGSSDMSPLMPPTTTIKTLIGENATGAKAADLNQDGIDDLVVSYSSSREMRVLMSRGDGRFDRSVPYATEANPGSLSILDIDNDGALDIVLDGGRSSEPLEVFLGNNDGSFGLPYLIDVPNRKGDIDFEDVNGDGFLDFGVFTDAGIEILESERGASFDYVKTITAA